MDNGKDLKEKEKENAPGQEEKGIAMEILGELKQQNERLGGFNKRLITALIVVICLWFLTIGGFVWYLSQYDFQSYNQDGNGYNNINTGTQGDVNNGTEIPGTEEETE